MIKANNRPITPQHEKWLAEMTKAFFRLQSFPNMNGQKDSKRPRAASMRWALDLAERDLVALSEGDLRNLQTEYACFSTFEMKEPYYREHIIEPRALFSRGEIAEAQQWLRTMVDGIRSHRPLEFQAPARHWFSVYSSEKHRWTKGYVEKENVAIVASLNALYNLILEHLDDLQECALTDCKKIFLRDRSNQLFCSKRCQWKDGQRKAQHVSPDRYGKRGRPVAIVKPSKKKLSTPGGVHHGKKK